MAYYQLKRIQNIPASKEMIWDFISSPKNLKTITPDYMGFDITSVALPEKMYQGMIISYTVQPIFGYKITWVTEITHVEGQEFFVDEQRIGPYSLWHHQHHLREIDGGVEMVDIVTYKPPFGIFGKIAHTLFIRRQLNEIFDYRYSKIIELFGEFKTEAKQTADV